MGRCESEIARKFIEIRVAMNQKETSTIIFQLNILKLSKSSDIRNLQLSVNVLTFIFCDEV
jgi:hypothetical protein